MRPTMQHPSIGAVRADALFVSALQRSDAPSSGQVRQAVAEAVRRYGDQGCAERVAQEYGDHPETAMARMRWARTLADEAFAEATPRRVRPRILIRHPLIHVRHAA
jgi:hypothetical protein